MSSTLLDKSDEYTRFDSDTSTCDANGLYTDFLDGFFGKFQDSFFYTGIIQFIIVTLMYVHVGKGKYWKMLFYAAIACFCGSVLENATVAYICLESNKQEVYSYIPSFLICEIFWIPSEYAIPYLNLIKMKAFTKEKAANYIKYIIIILTFPFIFFRFLIGYERMRRGYLQSPVIHTYHGYAFSVLAFADILCTICILYFVRKNNKNTIKTSNVNHFVKYSSYTILIAIDIVSSILSTLNILTNMGPFKDEIPGNYVKPLHCLKCSFILILAADALLFKYGANTNSSIHDSSRTYGCGTGSYNNYNFNKKGLYKTNNDYNNINDNSSVNMNKNCFINIGSSGYTSIDEMNYRNQNNNIIDNNYDIEPPQTTHKYSLSGSLYYKKYDNY